MLKGHKRGIWSVEFSPTDQVVLTASGDATLRMWALQDLSCLRTFQGHTAAVLRTRFVSGGTQVVSVGADGLLKLWSVRTSECNATYDQHEDKASHFPSLYPPRWYCSSTKLWSVLVSLDITFAASLESAIAVTVS